MNEGPVEQGTPRVSVKRLAAETLAIFLGVSLGFLADDFRDYRNDRREEREVLSQFLTDLALDSADIAPILPRSTVRSEAMLWLNNNATRVDLPSDSLTRMLNQLAEIDQYTYEAAAFTYSSLKSGGGLDLIRDAGLRRAIVFYFEDRQPVMEGTNAGSIETESRWWEQLAPYITFQPVADLSVFPGFRVVNPEGLLRDRDLLYRSTELGYFNHLQVDLTEQMLELNAALAQEIREVLR